MHINLIPDDILYHILEYHLDIINFRYIQKKWKDININSNQFEFILKRRLYTSPINTRLMIPKKKKIITIVSLNKYNKYNFESYVNLLNKIKKIKLYNTNYKLLFWKQDDYNKSSAHNIEFEMRLIYTKKRKLY
jgi:hypothetical protein